jgi:uncharacterized membrane protein YfcA
MSWIEVLAEWVVLWAAGLVRGFTGFGFAMVAVSGLSLFRAPAEVVPAVLVLELSAALHLLPRAWRDIEWPSLELLSLGALLGALPGALLLAHAPAAVLRLWVSAVVVVAALLLARGGSWHHSRGPLVTLAAGALSGLLNSSAAIGGPPVILFYLGSQASMHQSRASLIAFFTVVDAFSLTAAYWAGVGGWRMWLTGLAWLLPTWAGVVLGERLFMRKANEERYRNVAVALLALLGAIGAVRALWELAA